MRAFTIRELHKVVTIEVDAAVMFEVGILVGCNSAGVEPDLFLFAVDAFDRANYPIAFGDLIEEFSVGQ